jgi:hypothetical protein
MRRLVLIHWKKEEGTPKAALLQKAGYEVALEAPPDPTRLRVWVENPPAAFLIDLSRRATEGISLGIGFRRRKKTRRTPIVFMGGESEGVEKARRLLPDAAYVDWNRAPRDLQAAVERKVEEKPVVPDTMAGYSGTPLPKKLGIKESSVVALLGAPKDFEAKLEPLPEGVQFKREWLEGTTVAMLFVKSLSDYERRLPGAAKKVGEGSRLWVAWPKKASGIKTDITETSVRELGLKIGLVDYKICAIDETWSGLCFARRREK